MANFSTRPTAPPAIAAVGFDLDGTLFDRRKAMKSMLHAWPGLDAAAINIITEWDDLGRTPRRTFFQRWLRAFPDSVPASEAVNLSKTFQRRLAEHVLPDPAILNLLDALHSSGIPMALLSNGSVAAQQAKLRACGASKFFPPALRLYSSRLGVEKPNPKAFAALATSLRCKPDEILFCGDDAERDIAGALAAGMAACLVERDESGSVTEKTLQSIRSAVGLHLETPIGA